MLVREVPPGRAACWRLRTLILPAHARDFVLPPALRKAAPAGTRWITVHPNGKDEKGVPLLIKESSEEPGAYYVVGGAGGKMNHLKLTGVKSKEEHQEEQKVKQAEKRKKKKAEREQLARDGLLDKKKAADAAIDSAHQNKESERIKRKLAEMLPLLGLNPDAYGFPPNPQLVAGIEPGTAAWKMLEYQYHQKMESQLDRMLEERIRRQLQDPAARAAMGDKDLKLVKDHRTVDVEQARAEVAEGERHLENLDQQLTEAKERGDSDLIDALEAKHEALTEEVKQNREIVEADEASGPTIDQLEGYKPKAGVGYNRAAKERAVQNMIESGELDPEKLKKTAKNDTRGSDAIGQVAGLASTHRDAQDDPAVVQKIIDLAKQEMGKRKDALAAAAELAAQGDHEGAYRHWKKAEELATKWEERVEKAITPREKLTPGDYLGLVTDAVQNARANAAQMSEASRRGATAVPEEVQKAQLEYEKLRDALAIKKKHDALKAGMEKKKEELKQQGATAGYQIDSDAIGDKFDVDGLSDDQALLKAEEVMRIERDAIVNAALVKEVEESDELTSQLDISRVQLQRSMRQHISEGAFAGFSNATILSAGDVLLDRPTIDTFGLKGASSILAAHLKANLDPERYAALVEGLEAYHGETSTQHAEAALADAKDAYEAARRVAFEEITDPRDPVAMQYLNDKRRALLEDTMHQLGRTIGQLRAQAELLNALKKTKPDPLGLSLPMGDTDIDSIVQQMAALGVSRDDYRVSYDPEAKVRSVFMSNNALGKIARSDMTQEEVALAARGQAIKTGQHDQSGWLPAGIARRPRSTFDGPSPEAPQFAIKPDFMGREGGDLEGHVADFIGSRVADGMPVEDVIADMRSATFATDHLDPFNPGQQAAVEQAIRSHFPEFDAKQIRTPEDFAAFKASRETKAQELAEQFRTKQGIGEAALHSQGVDMGERTVEAVHRSLAADPAAVLAFKSPQELSAQEKHALRRVFWNRHSPEGKEASQAEKKRAEADKAQATEPARDDLTLDMFGGLGDEASGDVWGKEANAGRDIYGTPDDDSGVGAGAQESAAHNAWERYVQAHGGQDQAYRSIQETMRGTFAERFAANYKRVGGGDLKTSRTALSYADAHRVGLSPADRYEEALQQMREPMAAEMARVAQGAGGRFQAETEEGGRKTRALQSVVARQEGQSRLFQDAEAERANVVQRTTLGHRAEQQIASIINANAHAWNPKADPVKLFTVGMGDDSAQGKKFYKQQRAVRLIAHQGKVGLFFGAGSGKSLTTLAAFTHLEHQGKATRALYAVPSVVQKQFGGEALRFLDPAHQRRDGRTGYRWHADAGASKEERHAAYRDGKTDFLVLTHQAIRDDALEAIGQHRGMERDQVADWFNGLPREERAKTVKAAFDHMGWKGFDFLYVDEAHYITNRQGKANSTMANVMDAIGDNMRNHVLGTGTPVKNDASEAFDYLSKLDPKRFSDRAGFLRQYGANTQSHREALQRLTSRYFYQDRVESGVEGRQLPTEIKLSPAQRTAYDGVQAAYNRLQVEHREAKRARRPIDGKLLTEVMRTLSPNSFRELPEGEHERKARELLPASGTIRDAAFNRVINAGKFEENAKLQHIADLADSYRKAGKPGVVFARNLETVEELARGLRAEGHRVATLTGAMSGDDKDAARRAFAPESGKPEDATADILILSDAGNTGLNLQRGKWLAHVDMPLTSPVKEQRDARINRIGQTEDVDIHHLITDTPFDGKAKRRLERKAVRSHVFQDPSHDLDDTGLAAHVNAAYRRIAGQERMGAQALGAGQSGQRAKAASAADTAKQEARRKRTLAKLGRTAPPPAPRFAGTESPREAAQQLIDLYKPHVPVADWGDVESQIRETIGGRAGVRDWHAHINAVAQHIAGHIREFYE